ncbi:hypothetical protein [Microbacterium natoriense]|uniref:hypothetical protein n=1 Tax=Microbacterium natoriense TaxID=284570 RepID=UPI0031DF609A
MFTGEGLHLSAELVDRSRVDVLRLVAGEWVLDGERLERLPVQRRIPDPVTFAPSLLRGLTLALIFMGAGVSLAACAPADDVGNDRVDRVVSGYDGVELSEFESGVLEDGTVTQAEYDEAFAAWKTCVEGRGLTATDERDEFGIYRQAINRPKEQATEEQIRADGEVAGDCGKGTLLIVDAVYRDQVMNPASRDWDQGVVDCLIHEKVVEPDFNTEDLLSGQPPLPEAAYATTCLDNPFGVRAGS